MPFCIFEDACVTFLRCMKTIERTHIVCVVSHMYNTHTYIILPPPCTWVELRRWDVKLLILYSGLCLLEFIFLSLFSLLLHVVGWQHMQPIYKRIFYDFSPILHTNRMHTFNCDTQVPQTSDFAQNYFDLHSIFVHLFWKCSHILLRYFSWIFDAHQHSQRATLSSCK